MGTRLAVISYSSECGLLSLCNIIQNKQSCSVIASMYTVDQKILLKIFQTA